MKLILSVSLLFALCLPAAHSLKPAAPPIKRVAIIGTGIAGLSLAHALENPPQCTAGANKKNPGIIPEVENDVQVSLFESRPSLNFEAGAGIQLNGGMSVLHKINPKLQANVARAALTLTYIRSRAKPWGSTEKSPFSTLLEIDLEEAVRKVGGKTEEELIIDGELMCYTIMRGALQEILLSELSPSTTNRLQFGMSLSGIEANSASDEEGIMCKFENGAMEGPFDLVVGCDGIKSAVKEYIETGEISTGSDAMETRNAIYSGIRIIYGVADGDPENEDVSESAELRQYFGDGGYALAGTYGAGESRPPTRGAFFIFRDEEYNGPFKKKSEDENNVKAESSSSRVAENADWTQDVRTKGDARTDCSAKIKEMNVPYQEVGPIIEESDRFFELGVYFHNPFSLSGWKKKVNGAGERYCILAGDAAHAMPPFLGQGSNQAIQDAYCLASKIFDHNANIEGSNYKSTDNDDEEGKKDLQTLLKQYENQRWATTTSITLKAAFLGYLETGGEGFLSKFRDVFFFVLGKIGVARMVFLDGATPKV